MFEWEDVANKTEMEFVLKCIHEKIWNKKIVKIFDLYGNTFNWKKKENSYVCTDDDVYIMFEDNSCIIINLVNRSAAWIKYKKLSKKEKEEFNTIHLKIIILIMIPYMNSKLIVFLMNMKNGFQMEILQI